MSKTRDLANLADLNFDSGTMVVDKANDRVGVLNATPSHPFQVGTDDLIVDASGNLLVGKTASSNTTEGFTVTQNGLISSIITTAGGASQNLFLNRQDTDGNHIVFRQANGDVGKIGTNSGKLYIGSGDTGLRFVNTSNQIRPFNTDTGADRDNGFSLGSSGARFKDLYLSGGVYLGGTGAANYLDDYEEGTWTPTAVSGFTGTFSTQRAIYTKVGRLVNFEFEITLTSTPSVLSNPIFSLPFVCEGSVALTSYLGETGVRSHISVGQTAAGSARITMFATDASLVSVKSLLLTVPFTWASGDKFIVAGTYRTTT